MPADALTKFKYAHQIDAFNTRCPDLLPCPGQNNQVLCQGSFIHYFQWYMCLQEVKIQAKRHLFTILQVHNEAYGIRNQKSGIRRVGSGITAPRSVITNHGIRISSFLKDQAVPFLWDQGPKFVTLLGSRIRNLDTKMGSAIKNIPHYYCCLFYC